MFEVVFLCVVGYEVGYVDVVWCVGFVLWVIGKV